MFFWVLARRYRYIACVCTGIALVMIRFYRLGVLTSMRFSDRSDSVLRIQNADLLESLLESDFYALRIPSFSWDLSRSGSEIRLFNVDLPGSTL